MRTLGFIVDGQAITRDPCCDFSHIVAGTSNYLKASFTFSQEWSDCIVAASFWVGDKEYAALLKDNECIIPAEALTTNVFHVSVAGKRNTYFITSDKTYVRQEVFE